LSVFPVLQCGIVALLPAIQALVAQVALDTVGGKGRWIEEEAGSGKLVKEITVSKSSFFRRTVF
jgi:hypothetical protein